MSTSSTVVIGPRDTIEEVDERLCELLGYSVHELVGMHGSDLVPTERHAPTAVSLDRMRRSELAIRDGKLRRKDGTILDVTVEARVLPGNRLMLTVRPRS